MSADSEAMDTLEDFSLEVTTDSIELALDVTSLVGGVVAEATSDVREDTP